MSVLKTVNKSRKLSDITKLSPEHEAKIPFYRDKWTKIGTCCDPCDFEKSKESALMVYSQNNLPEPKNFHLCGSPIEAAELAVELKIKYRLLSSTMNKEEKSRAVKNSFDEQIYGYHEASWLAFYDFMNIEFDVEECKNLTGLIEIAKSCGWWAPYSENVIFQHRHKDFNLDEENLLHCEDGPAVTYPDGTNLWIIHGNHVDEQIVMHPETQTLDQIHGEKSADIRSIRTERYGWVNYIRNSNSECIDKRHNDVEGTKEALYKTKMGDIRLIVTCPTGRIFALGVASTVKNCEQAQQWLGPARKLNVVGRT